MAKRLLLCVLALLSTNAVAYTVGPATTYSDVVWSFSTNVAPISTCSQLRLDATGNWGVSLPKFLLSGVLYCRNFDVSYAIDGSGFMMANGAFNIVLRFATFTLFCGNLSGTNLGGACDVYDVSGVKVGQAAITLQ